MTRRLRRPVTGWFFVATILLGIIAIYSAPVADAHAVLESSSPSDQSVLRGAPARVLLVFSEPVSLVTGSLRVFDSSGNRVDSGVASHAGSSRQVAVNLKPDLEAGSYAVAWRVISADAHPVHGGFVFSVQRSGTVAGLDRLIDQPSQPGYEAAGAVLRALGYLGSFVVVGAAVFAAFVQRRHEPGGADLAVLSLITAITVVVQLLQLPVSAALATGEGLGSLFDPGVVHEVLGQGVVVTLAGIALGSVVGLGAVRTRPPWRRPLSVVSLVLVTGAFVASGHTRSTDPTWLVVIFDAVHVAAGAVWVGGLIMLAWSLRSRRRELPMGDPTLAAQEVVGFSRIATVAILGVTVAGIVMAYLEVRSLHGLVTTAYGRLVLAKVGAMVVLGCVGAFNHFRLLPALRRRPDRPTRWQYLRTAMRIEALVFVGVLGVTGVLVNAVPSRTIVSQRAIYTSTAKIGKGSINLVIDPARTGPTALHLYLLDAQGRPDDAEESVEIALTQKKLGIGPVSHSLRRAGPGHWVANGTLFTVPGDWQVVMRVRVDEFDENSAVLAVKIPT